MYTVTGPIQQLTVKAPWTCVWVGPNPDAAEVFFVEYPWPQPDPQGAAETTAKVLALAAAAASHNDITLRVKDNSQIVIGVELRAGPGGLDPRYRPRDDFSVDDPHNDARYRPLANFTADDAHNDPRFRPISFAPLDDPHNDARYRPLGFAGDDVHNDARYRPLGFALDDPHNDVRYLSVSAQHDQLPGSGAPRHHEVVVGSALMSFINGVSATAITPAMLAFPADTLARNPVVLRATIFGGTGVFGARTTLGGTGWTANANLGSTPATGTLTVELVVRIDPP
ncbi:MAG TPA: hypothetical protein VFC90_07955 [Planctomycetota bacterium]|nr:hypothetical protein [Planctomycetota bacterium]